MTDFREPPEDPRRMASNRIPQPSGNDMDSDRMTEGQRSYLQRLCDKTGEPFDDSLSIAQAHRRIEELERRAGSE
jgi:hypothetical protein